MKKRIFTIFLIMILAVTNLSVCYADGLSDLTSIGLDPNSQKLDSEFSQYNNSVTPEYREGTWDKVSGIAKTITGLLGDIVNWIVRMLIYLVEVFTPSADSVIFNEGVQWPLKWGEIVRLSYFDEAPVGLAKNLVGFVSSVYQAFRYIALIFFVIAIAVIAVKMIFSSIGRQKQKYKDDLKHWLIGLILLVVGHWIMIYLIYFSDYLVELIRELKNSLLSSSGSYKFLEDGLNYIKNPTLTAYFSYAAGASIGGNIIGATTTGAAAYVTAMLTGLVGAWWAVLIIFGILILIAVVVFVAMNLKIFKVYLERVIIVGVLIMIFPLVTVFYAFEKASLKKGSTFESWLRTFIEQVYIQPIHAISLLFVMVALGAIADSGIIAIPILGMVFVIIVLNTVFEIENVIKRVISVSGARLAQPADLMRGAAMVGKGINAGLAVGQMIKHKNGIRLPKLGDKDENGNRKYTGENDPAYIKLREAQEGQRRALLTGTLQGWAFNALSSSPLHIDSKLLKTELSNSEGIRIRAAIKSMVLKGSAQGSPETINDAVSYFKSLSPPDRAQFLASVGEKNVNMSPEEFGKLASTNERQFLEVCAKMVEFDPKEKLDDILASKGSLTDAQINILAAALVKASDKMEALSKVFNTKDLCGELEAFNNNAPDKLRGIAAVLTGNAKVDKVFDDTGNVDLSYTINPATKEQAHAVVNNINLNTDYTVASGESPMNNINVTNVMSAAAGYREKLSPDVMNQIVANVGNILNAQLNAFKAEFRKDGATSESAAEAAGIEKRLISEFERMINENKRYDAVAMKNSFDEFIKTGNVANSSDIYHIMREIRKNIK